MTRVNERNKTNQERRKQQRKRNINGIKEKKIIKEIMETRG
jgi:hypothetical protein